MEVTSALALIGELIYKPGWEITAEDHTNRFEGTIKVTIGYPARSSERPEAALGYPHKMHTRASFPMIVRDCDDTMIYKQILLAINAIDCHEAREFLRVKPTMWAPFHPHRIDGMERWGATNTDLVFGIG